VSKLNNLLSTSNNNLSKLIFKARPSVFSPYYQVAFATCLHMRSIKGYILLTMHYHDRCISENQPSWKRWWLVKPQVPLNQRDLCKKALPDPPLFIKLRVYPILSAKVCSLTCFLLQTKLSIFCLISNLRSPHLYLWKGTSS